MSLSDSNMTGAAPVEPTKCISLPSHIDCALDTDINAEVENQNPEIQEPPAESMETESHTIVSEPRAVSVESSAATNDDLPDIIPKADDVTVDADLETNPKTGQVPESDDDEEKEEEGAEEWEVEAVKDFCIDENMKEWFFVKWVNWSKAHNTWEPRENLENAEEKVALFLEQMKEKRDASAKGSLFESLKSIRDLAKQGHVIEIKPLPKELAGLGTHLVSIAPKKDHDQLMAEASATLAKMEQRINETCIAGGEPPNIRIQNIADAELLPRDFHYITDYIFGAGVDVPSDAPMGAGCDCTHPEEKGVTAQICSYKAKHCCPIKTFDTLFAYTLKKSLRIARGSPIYECNNSCSCIDNKEACGNRVVQWGRKIPMTVFRSKSKGWGLRVDTMVRKDTFVIEYLGEVITNEEAEKRGMVYDRLGSTYLFDLDFDMNRNKYTIDSNDHGNVSRFINHSCDPNLVIFPVWINKLDPNMPRIALFSRREIAKGEELTFSYNNARLVRSRRVPKIEPDEAPDNETCYASTSGAGIVTPTKNNKAKGGRSKNAAGKANSKPVDDSKPSTSTAGTSQSEPMDEDPYYSDGFDDATRVATATTPTAIQRQKCLCGTKNCVGYFF